MNEYVPTIGLEIHAELKTKTKMFCNSKNDPFAAEPNTNICPVCMAHPGTLPVINREAVRHVLRVGTALGGKHADYTEFDRKNYFYPDLPKGYQLSQYEYPLVSGGILNSVALTRIHLEEDTASSTHDESTNATTIDFNRSGVPLMELVTEPVIHSAEAAGRFARELQLLLRYLGASDANMEKGEMRVEANISVGKNGQLGTKVEIKNLNSFRIMEKAVEYEIARQSKLLDSGGVVVQETRGWDDGKQATFAQRTKEGSADYRYFPDPDLPSIRISEVEEFSHGSLENTLPELPASRRSRYVTLGVRVEDADLFVRERKLGDFFDGVINFDPRGKSASVVLAANYIANDLVKIIRDIEGRDADYQAEIPISVQYFGKILDMVSKSQISSRAAKDILIACSVGGNEPEKYAAEMKLFAEKATNLDAVISDVLEQHKRVADEYCAGKTAALEFLVGQVMRIHRGADPEQLRLALKEHLSKTIRNS